MRAEPAGVIANSGLMSTKNSLAMVFYPQLSFVNWIVRKGRKTCCDLVIFTIKLMRKKEEKEGSFQICYKTKRAQKED